MTEPGAAAVPAEIRERLNEWLALAEQDGAAAVAARLDEQNRRYLSEFQDAAAAVNWLLRE
ncbi:MAG: hypothetical protein IT162_02500 [Bryobacterales bacterium]|nr:hypothetical protein [Bryobacterales bacterium]